ISAIVGCIALALMETLSDYGTVAHFGVQTFTTGIYKALYSMDDLVAAGQLATMLLTIVFVVAIIERLERNRLRFDNGNSMRELPRYILHGKKACAAAIVCFLPVLFGFLIPISSLISLHIIDGHNILSKSYVLLTMNSLSLSGTTSCVATLFALIIVYASRLAPGWLSGAAVELSHLGYAVPGSVIAIGMMFIITSADYIIDLSSRQILGVTTGMLLTGSVTALVMAYTSRFIAVSLNSLETNLSQIPRSIDNAARTLGSGQFAMLRRIHLPLIRSGLLTATLMVFVDVMKELPATLLLRPFNFDTLATQAYRLASDERLAQAATPSLVLVGFGLLPVVVLSRQIMATRIGV
ncbi:MAG: iron ABC transporter permease, partial [Hyphomicrobiaceae bacterium]|nr:iron ABC transporter permease [Hyphomicrobiaceae bacterium]